jgi:hypothetical protein
VLAARPVAAWAGVLLAAAGVLFWCYLRQSQTARVNSDGAGPALQAWEMLHGNLLLSGWWLADATFYTFEVPLDAVVEWVRGLNPDVVHIGAAMIYTLLVLSAALLARGRARGAEGVTRAVLAAGIMVAPTLYLGTRVLLFSPNHTGVGVPILATLLLLDRARERMRVPVAMGVLLFWAQLDDPLATYAAALPIALVCVVRAAVPLALRRRPSWYDGWLAAAALVSVGLANLAVPAIKAAGGYAMQPLTGMAMIVPAVRWGGQIRASAGNVLILFGADFFDQPGRMQTAIAFAHFAGVALAAAGFSVGLAGLVRGADRVTQILTVGIGATLVAVTFGTLTAPVSGAHEMATVLPYGAVLAGRTVGPWLAGRRLRAVTLGPLLGGALACYLAVLGFNASQPALAADTQGLADWLVAHHLTDGLGKYWVANSTTLSSGGRVRVASIQTTDGRAYPWMTKPGWYDPAVSYANFVIASPAPEGNPNAFPEKVVRAAFGPPAREYRFGIDVIMVWNRNILLQVPRPDRTLHRG